MDTTCYHDKHLGYRGLALRITGGEARGRVITAPDGLLIRPTASKVRQAFFNILGNKLNGCSFLDICAGTGLIGIEALSRGAASLVSVEENRQVAKAIEKNLRHLGYEGEVISGDLRMVLPILQEKSFDIIFADPPYKSGLQNNVLQLVNKHKLLADEGTLIIEHLRNIGLPDKFESLKRSSERHYGQTSLSFFEMAEQDEESS